MFTTRDSERLYLSNWEYNMVIILNELRNIVKNNGGNVKKTNTAIVTNRTLSEAKREAEQRLEQLEKIEKEIPGNNEHRTKAIKEYRDKVGKYSNVDNTPIELPCASWITFTLDGMYYSLSMDDNPFFDFYLIKTPIVDGKYSQDASAEVFTRDWLYDCFFRCDASQDDRKEAANMIFNACINAKRSPIIRDKKRIRVPNKYDDNYHYETIYGKERIAEVTF